MVRHQLFRKSFSMLIALILAISSTLVAVQPAAAATTTFEFSLSSNMLPDPFGDIAEEFTDFESVSISGTMTDNSDGSGEVGFAVAVAAAECAINDTDGNLDGELTTNVTVSWDSDKKVSDVNFDVGGSTSVKLQLLKAAKVIKLVKLASKANRHSKRLGEALEGVELDAGVYLYIDASGEGTIIGSDASTLSFGIGVGAEIEDVRLGSFHLNEYAAGSIKPLSFGLDYTPAENSWKVTFKPSYSLQLIQMGDEYWIDWGQEGEWTIYENGVANTNPIPDAMGGEVKIIENDASIAGDAGNSQGSARNLGTVSYVTRGGLLNGTGDEDWYKITIADTDMPISLKLAPPDSGDYDLYVKSDTGVVASSTGTGNGLTEQVVLYDNQYNSDIYLKVYRKSGEAGHYHLDMRYYQTAEAVQVSVAEGTGNESTVTLAGQTQTTQNGKTLFLDVPYGTYTASATEQGTNYSGSETVVVGSLLEAFVVKLNMSDPSGAYYAGDDYDGMLLPDHSTSPSGRKGWVKVSDQGETIYIKAQDVECSDEAYLIVNDGSSSDDNLFLYENESAKYGGMKVYLDYVFCGSGDPLWIAAGVEIYYEGYAPAAPRSPTGASAVHAGGIGVYTAKTTDTDGDQVKYTFDWGDGSPNETTGWVNSGQQVSLAHTWSTPGSYTVRVKATDSENLVSDWSSGLNIVVNALPAAAFTFSPADPTTADTVSFTDSSTDSDGTVTTWVWGFGDGAASTVQNPTHQYTAAGTYEVFLTVTDNKGAMATTSREVTVTEASSTTWDVKYEADVLPQSDGWSMPGWYSGGAAVSDGILTLNAPDGALQYWQRGSSSSFAEGITLKARVKVTSPGALGQIALNSAHYGDKNIMLRYDSIWGVSITPDVYHTIQLTLDDSTGILTLYVDGEWKKEQASGSPGYSFAVLFGNEWWWGGPTASMWDYVYYTSGVHPPQ